MLHSTNLRSRKAGVAGTAQVEDERMCFTCRMSAAKASGIFVVEEATDAVVVVAGAAVVVAIAAAVGWVIDEAVYGFSRD